MGGVQTRNAECGTRNERRKAEGRKCLWLEQRGTKGLRDGIFDCRLAIFDLDGNPACR